MTTKIGLCGVHGSGKTTRVKEMHDHYVDIGNMVFVVDEVARSCPHTLRTIEAQEWIWYEQIAQEAGAMLKDVDIVICDRTVMDNLMYYRDVLTQMEDTRVWRRWWTLYYRAKNLMPTYTQVIRMPINLEWLQADDPIRPKDVVYAQRIDALFNQFVRPHVTAE